MSNSNVHSVSNVNIGQVVPSAGWVAAGSCHSLVVTTDGEVFTFGRNSRGQLGHLPVGSQAFPPTSGAFGMTSNRMEDSESVVSLLRNTAKGKKDHHKIPSSVYVDNKGEPLKVKSFDSLHQKKSISREIPDSSSSRTLTSSRILRSNAQENNKKWASSFPNMNTTSSKSGDQSVDCKSSKSTIFTSMRVSAIPSQNRVVSGSCGGSHTLLLTTNGGVLSMGRNKEGQLGLGDKMDRHEPTLIPPESFEYRLPVQVSCGASHSLVVCQDGSVYSFGDNSCGQLGIDTKITSIKYKPNLLSQDVFGNEKVIWAECGDLHSIFITEKGHVYASGWNQDGQLGLGDNKNRGKPSKLLTDGFLGLHPVSAACGELHSLVLCEDGSVFGFGWNEDGQLGLGRGRSIYLPIQIPPEHLGKQRVVSVHCGEKHSMLLCEDGSVYVMGANNKCQLGLLERENKFYPHKLNFKWLGFKKVVQIACGWQHTLIISEEGLVYSWGHNKNGQLGIGGDDIISFPKQVKGDLEIHCKRLLQIQSLSNNTVMLCQGGVLFGEGTNLFGQLGLGSRSKSVSLTQLWPQHLNGSFLTSPVVSYTINPHSLYIVTCIGEVYGAGALLGPAFTQVFSFLTQGGELDKAESDIEKENSLIEIAKSFTFENGEEEWLFLEREATSECKRKVYENLLQAEAIPPWEDQHYRSWIDELIYNIRQTIPEPIRQRLTLSILPLLIKHAKDESKLYNKEEVTYPPFRSSPTSDQPFYNCKDVKVIVQEILTPEFVEKYLVPSFNHKSTISFSQAYQQVMAAQLENQKKWIAQFAKPAAVNSTPSPLLFPTLTKVTPINNKQSENTCYTISNYSSDLLEMEKYRQNLLKLESFKRFLCINVSRFESLKSLGVFDHSPRNQAYLLSLEQIHILKDKMLRSNQKFVSDLANSSRVSEEGENFKGERERIRQEYKDQLQTHHRLVSESSKKMVKVIHLARDLIREGDNNEEKNFYQSVADKASDEAMLGSEESDTITESPLLIGSLEGATLQTLKDNFENQTGILAKLETLLKDMSVVFSLPYHEAASFMVQNLDAVRLLERQAKVILLDFGDLKKGYIQVVKKFLRDMEMCLIGIQSLEFYLGQEIKECEQEQEVLPELNQALSEHTNRKQIQPLKPVGGLMHSDPPQRINSFEILRRISFTNEFGLTSSRIENFISLVHESLLLSLPLNTHCFPVDDERPDSLFKTLEKVNGNKELLAEWFWQWNEKTYSFPEMLPIFSFFLVKEGAVEVASENQKKLEEQLVIIEDNFSLHPNTQISLAVYELGKRFLFLPVKEQHILQKHHLMLYSLGLLIQKCLLEGVPFPLSFGQTFYMHLTQQGKGSFLQSVTQAVCGLEEFDLHSAQRCWLMLSEDDPASENIRQMLSLMMSSAGMDLPTSFDRDMMCMDRENIITEFAHSLLCQQRQTALNLVFQGFALGERVSAAATSLAYWEIPCILEFSTLILSSEEIWEMLILNKMVEEKYAQWIKLALYHSNPLLLRVFLFHLFHHLSLAHPRSKRTFTVFVNLDPAYKNISFIPSLHVMLVPQCENERTFQKALEALLECHPLDTTLQGTWTHCQRCFYPFCLSSTPELLGSLSCQWQVNKPCRFINYDAKECPHCHSSISEPQGFETEYSSTITLQQIQSDGVMNSKNLNVTSGVDEKIRILKPNGQNSSLSLSSGTLNDGKTYLLECP